MVGSSCRDEIGGYDNPISMRKKMHAKMAIHHLNGEMGYMTFWVFNKDYMNTLPEDKDLMFVLFTHFC